MNNSTLDTKKQNEWQGRTDGTSWMHASLTAMLRYVPLRAMYLFADLFVVPFYMLFSKSYLSTYHYFRRRLGRNPIYSFVSTYRNFCQFSKNILDKFKMFSGGSFDFDIDHMELYERLSKQDGGFLIFSAHIGNYELAGYTLRADTKPYNALVFGGEAEMIMKNRTKMFADKNIRMIPVSDDMSHLITLSNALADGESVSIPADRVVGDQKTMTCNFLGAEAKFPAGPFMLAAKRRLPVLSIQVMKESAHKYKIYIKELEQIGETLSERASCLLSSYTHHLETVLNRYPLQWFNFYEFWK